MLDVVEAVLYENVSQTLDPVILDLCMLLQLLNILKKRVQCFANDNRICLSTELAICLVLIELALQTLDDLSQVLGEDIGLGMLD